VVHCREITQKVDFAALHQFKPQAYPYFFASNTRGRINTRYSIILAYPEPAQRQRSADIDCLDVICTNLAAPENDSKLPFVGGWFVFLSYEYARSIEPGVEFFEQQSGLPVSLVSRVPAAIIIDHEQDRCTLVADCKNKSLLGKMEEDIRLAREWQAVALPALDIVEENPQTYRDNLAKIHRYIVEGDIFQANLSRRWSVHSQQKIDALSLYEKLRHSNPSPFAAFCKVDDHYILSSSPERLVSVRQGIVETRPIAGTHPRGETALQDAELSKKLLSHPKERAEHVMLIDLERNDLGRICRPGSIQVQDNMTLETYSHVHHIVSSIRGELQPDATLKQVIHAVFPGGTITGCPKVRCMEIISELEQAARGAYTGSVGYVSDNGNVDFNILIRTLTLKDNRVDFRAGAGIVHDSISERELNETRHKARGMLDAFQAD
jgi:anthranilate synthase component 1